jgi:hypothetical protein
MRVNLFFLLVSIGLASCETPMVEEDYRDPFEGTFHFTTVHRTIAMCYPPSPTCVDGWHTIYTDTSNLVSYVEASGLDRIYVEFGTDTIGTGQNPNNLFTQAIFPLITETGVLTLPEYDGCCHDSFEGEYTSLDTINITITHGHQSGGYQRYDVIGIRED